MQTFILAALALLLVITIFLLFKLYNKIQDLKKNKDGEANMYLMLQNQIQDMNR